MSKEYYLVRSSQEPAGIRRPEKHRDDKRPYIAVYPSVEQAVAAVWRFSKHEEYELFFVYKAIISAGLLRILQPANTIDAHLSHEMRIYEPYGFQLVGCYVFKYSRKYHKFFPYGNRMEKPQKYSPDEIVPYRLDDDVPQNINWRKKWKSKS